MLITYRAHQSNLSLFLLLFTNMGDQGENQWKLTHNFERYWTPIFSFHLITQSFNHSHTLKDAFLEVLLVYTGSKFLHLQVMAASKSTRVVGNSAVLRQKVTFKSGNLEGASSACPRSSPSARLAFLGNCGSCSSILAEDIRMAGSDLAHPRASPLSHKGEGGHQCRPWCRPRRSRPCPCRRRESTW